MEYVLAALSIVLIILVIWKRLVLPEIRKIDAEVALAEAEQAEQEEPKPKPRQKNWAEEDTTIAYYIARFGVSRLSWEFDEIAEMLGRSERSLEAKIDRIQHYEKDDSTSDLSREIIERYIVWDEVVFRQVVLEYINKL